MKILTDMTPDEISDIIIKAIKWRREHLEHVRNLEAAEDTSVPPSGSDCFNPELWKGMHWRFLSDYSVPTPAKVKK